MTCAIYAKTAAEQQRIGNVMRYVLILALMVLSHLDASAAQLVDEVGRTGHGLEGTGQSGYSAVHGRVSSSAGSTVSWRCEPKMPSG